MSTETNAVPGKKGGWAVMALLVMAATIMTVGALAITEALVGINLEAVVDGVLNGGIAIAIFLLLVSVVEGY